MKHLKIGLLIILVMFLFGLSEVYAEEEKFEFKKPVTIGTTGPAGSPLDFISRSFAEHLSGALGVPVRVANMPGGNHLPGYDSFVSEKPDGYHVFVSILNTLSQHQYWGRTKADLLDVPFISLVNLGKQTMFVHKTNSEIKDFHDLINYKKPIVIGDQGYDSANVPTFIGIFEAFKIPFKYTPGFNPADLTPALARGELKMICRGHSQMVAKGLTDELQGILMTGYTAERDELLPDVPTLGEMVEKYGISTEKYPQVKHSWVYHDNAFLALPVNTPKYIVKTWEEIARKLYKDPKFLAFFEGSGLKLDVVGYEESISVAKGFKDYFHNIDLKKITMLAEKGVVDWSKINN